MQAANHIYVDRVADLASVSLVGLPSGATVLGGGDFLLAVDRQLVAEQCQSHGPSSSQHIAGVIDNPFPNEDIAREALLIARFGIETWGHWLGELLPKAVLAETKYPGRFAFAVPSAVLIEGVGLPWLPIRQSLEAYGIDESRMIPLDSTRNYRFQKLFAVTPVWSDDMIHPGATEAMRSGIPAKGARMPGRRAAIRRMPGYSRALDNGAELETLLRVNGFVSCTTGTMSFLQQVDVFRHSDLVFGVLGSDLTGLIYAPKGVKVVTAAPSIFGDRFFYGLILDRGGQQIDLRGPVTEFDSDRGDDWMLHPKFHIDPAELEKAISLFTGAPAKTQADFPGGMIPGTCENGVLVGNNGHLFLAGDYADSFDPGKNAIEIAESSYDAFKVNIERRIGWAGRNQARFLHLIVPDKPSIIPEEWPGSTPPKLGAHYIERFPELADHILYPIEALSKEREQAISRVDTHLRDYGSILMASMLVEKLTGSSQADAFNELIGRLKQDGTFFGDLGGSLTPPISDSAVWLDSQDPGQTFLDENDDGSNGGADLRFNPDPIYNARVILFGDSFGREIARMLQFWYSEVLFFRSVYFHEEIADLCKPDILITENVDRYMGFCSSDEERPNFLLYPRLQSAAHVSSPEFSQALNAVLSFPRKPYAEFVSRLRSAAKSPARLGASMDPASLQHFDGIALTECPGDMGLIATLEEPKTVRQKSPAFVADFSGRDLSIPPVGDQYIHGSYLVGRNNCLLFGPNHLVTSDGAWSCETRSYREQFVELVQSDTYQAIFPGYRPVIDVVDSRYVLGTSQLTSGQVERIDTPIFLATPLEPGTWGRWIATVLPKSDQYKKYGEGRKFFCMLEYPWQRQFLSLLGIEDDMLLAHDPGRTYWCGDVMTVEYSVANMTISDMEKDFFSKTADRFRLPDSKGRKLFISRRSLSQKYPHYRVLQNEGELSDALVKMGFTIVEPETLPIADQIGLFSSAEYIVSLGGSALYNMVFCAPGTKVITIEASAAFVDMHTHLLSSLGLEFGVIFGREDPSDTAESHKRWTIDVERTVAQVNEFCAA
jgi:capsular polysaccharide biosynthesis protein